MAGEKTISIWTARLEKIGLPLRLGYLRLGCLHLKGLVVTTGGILGDDSEQACRILLKCASQVMMENHLDVIVLSHLRCDHTLFELAASTFPPWYCRDWGVVPSIHWRMSLPSSFDLILQQRRKKHRYWLKRLPKVLEDDFPGQVRIRQFKDLVEVGEFCRDADIVARSTYQRQLGEAFRADAEHTERCKLFAEKGAFRGYILYITNEPRAYWMATINQQTLYLNSTGYSPDMKKYELGTVLLMRLFADHCGTTIDKVDFGLGGAAYKERFGDESFYEATVRIYKASPRAVLANILAGTNERASSGIRTLLSKLGLLQRIKTFWRAKLSN